VIRVESNTAADRGVFTVKLIDSANYSGTGVTYSEEIEFSVTVTDPCLTTTLTDLIVPDVSVQAGLIDTFTFAELTDTAGTAVSDQTICGARTYTVFKVASNGDHEAQTMVTFNEDGTGAAHTLVTTTQDEVNDVGVHNMKLVVSFPDVLYPVLSKTFTVTIETPVCDCSLLEW